MRDLSGHSGFDWDLLEISGEEVPAWAQSTDVTPSSDGTVLKLSKAVAGPNGRGRMKFSKENGGYPLAVFECEMSLDNTVNYGFGDGGVSWGYSDGATAVTIRPGSPGAIVISRGATVLDTLNLDADLEYDEWISLRVENLFGSISVEVNGERPDFTWSYEYGGAGVAIATRTAAPTGHLFRNIRLWSPKWNMPGQP